MSMNAKWARAGVRLAVATAIVIAAAESRAQDGSLSLATAAPRLLGAQPTVQAGAGKFVLGLGVGATFVQMSRFRYGDNFANSGFDPSPGPVYDSRQRRAAATPEIEGAYGIPGGIMGVPAEAYVRFAYYHASANTSDLYVRNGAPSWIFPMVGALTLPVSGSTFTGLDPGLPLALSIRQAITSYEGGIGLRVRRDIGVWTLAPSAEFGFQRLSQRHDIDLAFAGTDFGGNPITTGGPTRADLDADVFRFGLGLAASRPIAHALSWFVAIAGSLDVVRARLSASSVFTRYDGMFDYYETGSVSVSQRRTVVSGRMWARSGLAYTPMPGLAITVVGGVQYTGAVPYVAYPTHTNYNAGNHTNGSGEARIGFAGQLNYLVAFGLTLRF
ncbi:MAG: hypothetical protein KIT16_15065 [Rhodospirillaceae bacterium]|nr:hypothetical protein [Rhodospirillaceae bacterium]